jgi:hypothetical protein
LFASKRGLKVQSENDSTSTSRNQSLSAEHLKRMPNALPQQQQIRLDERKARLKANLMFFSVCYQDKLAYLRR